MMGSTHAAPPRGDERLARVGAFRGLFRRVEVGALIGAIAVWLLFAIVAPRNWVSITGVARIAQAGVMALETLQCLLQDRRVVVQPVIDLPRIKPEERYRPSRALREAVRFTWGDEEAFPFSSQSRRLRRRHQFRRLMRNPLVPQSKNM